MSFLDEHSDLIKAWLNKSQEAPPPDTEEGKAYHKVITTSGGWQVAGGQSESEAWQKLSAQIGNQDAGQQKGKVVPMRRYWLAGIAASVLLCALGLVWLGNPRSQPTTLATAKAETQQVTLPDGSTVTLGVASTLEYTPQQWPKQRRLTLQGEAFFKVKPGSSFTVVSQQGTTEVKGTSFNIYARGNNYTVACYTGKVVVSNEKELLLLVRGEQVAFDGSSGNTYKQAFDPTKPGWRQGRLNTKGLTVQTALQALELHYDIEIDISEKSKKSLNRKVTIESLPLDDLDGALTIITELYRLEYDKEVNKKVIIK